MVQFGDYFEIQDSLPFNGIDPSLRPLVALVCGSIKPDADDKNDDRIEKEFHWTQTWSAPSQTVERRLQRCPRNLAGGASLLVIFVVNIRLYLQIVFLLLIIHDWLCISPDNICRQFFICICCYNLPPIDPNCQSIELQSRNCHLCGTPAPLELSCTGVGWSCRRGSASSPPDHLCTWPWVWGHW